MPTQDQLNNRLNPTAVTVPTPASGLFRATNDFGSMLYRRNPDGTVTTISLLDPANGFYAQGTVGAGTQAGQAIQNLKTKYGIDWNSLPSYNIGDLQSSGAIPGFVYDPYGQHDASNAQVWKKGTINDFISVPPATPGQNATINGPEVAADIAKYGVVPQGQTPLGPDGAAVRTPNLGGGGYADTQTPTGTAPTTTNATGGTATPPTQAVAGASTTQAPTLALQPGATGDSVKQLQNWLLSQGYLTQQQIDTGPGIYGPQTTAAVAKWQTDHGVDNSTGPGYWGPKSIAAVQTQAPTGGTSTTPATNTQQTTTPSTSDVDFNSKLLALGLTQDQINGLDPTQRALLATVGDIATNTYANGSGITLNDAIKYAQQDPSILAKYGDALKIDQKALQQGLADLQFATDQDAQKTQLQFENDRKALAEQQGAAGTAYSGFRGQAQEKLGTQESGIVESSKRTLQKQLNDATSAFEAKYGTAATTPATAQFKDPLAGSNISLSGQYSPSGTPANTLLTGTTAGSITGTQPLAKQADILNKAASTYQFGQLPTATA